MVELLERGSGASTRSRLRLGDRVPTDRLELRYGSSRLHSRPADGSYRLTLRAEGEQNRL